MLSTILNGSCVWRGIKAPMPLAIAWASQDYADLELRALCFYKTWKPKRGDRSGNRLIELAAFHGSPPPRVRYSKAMNRPARRVRLGPTEAVAERRTDGTLVLRSPH